MQKALILSFFIFSLLSGVSFAEYKSEKKELIKLYCKDLKDTVFPKDRPTRLFFDGAEVVITKHTDYFFKNIFYKFINKYEKKVFYIELDMTRSRSSKFYTEHNFNNNELYYTFFDIFPGHNFNRDGKKIKEFYEKKKDEIGLFTVKLNKQTLNGSYEFKSPAINSDFKDTTGEFKCEISSRKI